MGKKCKVRIEKRTDKSGNEWYEVVMDDSPTIAEGD
jgi:hypothetical protein